MKFTIKNQILIFIIVILPTSISVAQADELKIAVRANKGADIALQRWQATVDYLNTSIPEHNFVMIPFENNSTLNQAISRGDFSFCLTNPAAAVEHRIRYKNQPLATLVNKRQGKGYSKFGSVIFTRLDRSDINIVQDLKGKVFIGADELGFGGWRVAWREMLKQGVNPYKDFSELRFAGGIQQRVVYSVLEGEVDAGSVRTDMLERMAAKGNINLADFKVISQKQTEGFPFLHSTDLYPEWLFSANKFVPNELKTKVAIALLSIEKQHEAAKKGKYVGWVPPLDYTPVDELLNELKVGPYHISQSSVFDEFINQYFYVVTTILVLLVGLVLAFFIMVNMNRRISQTQLSLQGEIKNRERAEHVLTSLAQQSLVFSKDESFFNDCLINLSHLFSAKFAFVGLFENPEKTRIKTYAVWAGDKFVDNFEYELEGTPCQDVINLDVELIGDGAADKYPDDQMLVQMGIDSYFGAPLISPNGLMMGLVSVMDTRPMNPEEALRPILRIFANRIALEMQRKREEEELHVMARSLSYQATHDSLTGLVNRREFELRMKQAWDSAITQHEEHALCYLDLDQFKVVNDTCGHGAGDQLLKQLAVTLGEFVRGSDTLARLGGDEFGVLLLDCPLKRAEDVAEKLLDTIKNYRFSWEDNVFEIGVSIGVVPINQYSRDIYELLQAADSACYVAKDLGRNRVHIYQEDDIAVAAHKGELLWVTEINRALKENDLVLYRQPIQALNTSSEVKDHYEILLRMKNEQGEILLPGAFIVAAERYNLMYSLDKWVVENSFQFISRHYSKQDRLRSKDVMYAINLSGLSLGNESLADYIEQMLKRYDLSPEVICFEITETSAITNFTQAVKFIEQMKRLGFCFALDDFGTGVCSYAYLKKLPVNYLKIDGHFVSGLLDDPMNRAIIESIVHIAKVMQVHTIAEWVEDEKILNELKTLGVNYIQGYHVGSPSPIPN